MTCAKRASARKSLAKAAGAPAQSADRCQRAADRAFRTCLGASHMPILKGSSGEGCESAWMR
eukprot:5053749-Pleurochrysis_carterae.AAC.1